MQVILQMDISSLGKAGDIVNVSEGYGRNYLLPQKKAMLADEKNVRVLEHQKREIAAKQLKVKREAEDFAQKLQNITITITKEVGEGDRLFGSVTNKDIANELRKQGLSIDRHAIQLAEPIKSIGVYDVSARLHSEVTGVLKVWVVKK